MKTLSLSLAAIVLGTSAALAGGYDAPVVEMAPVEIMEDTTEPASSNAGLIVPLILVALIAAAIASSD